MSRPSLWDKERFVTCAPCHVVFLDALAARPPFGHVPAGECNERGSPMQHSGGRAICSEQMHVALQSCETCINGTFSDWSAWGACSASCIGGYSSFALFA
eukprot:4104737-Amphidinium_carterae.1